MLEKDSLPLGLIIGLLLPLLAFGVFYGIFEGLEAMDLVSSKGFRPMFRERTTAILAIALNAFFLNFYQKRRYTRSVRGVVIVTTTLVVVWLVVFGKYVL